MAPAVMLVGLTSGCLSIQDPPTDLASGQLEPPARFIAAEALDDGEVRDNWIADFADERLVRLVEEAIAFNPDLEAAAARVEAAAARIDLAAAALRPRLDGALDTARFDEGTGDQDLTSLNLQVGWEVDLWGRLRSDTAAVRQEAIATALDYAYARQSLAALVADAWFLAVASKLQLAIDLDRLEAEEQTAEITRERTVAGISTQLDNELAQANVDLARAAVEESRSALEESVRAMEILLGGYPAAELEVADALPPQPAPVPTGVPSDLLERRPDVRAADRLVAAAFYGVESAKAARLPRITLTGALGAVLDPTNGIWSIGAGLLQPLYTGGAIAAEIEITEARQREALAIYVAVGIDAFREGESALANEAYLTERSAYLDTATARLASASEISQARYDGGILTIFELIQTRRQYFDTRSLLLQVQTERLRQRINLYLALGGSFDVSEAVDAGGEAGRNQEFVHDIGE
ncbi:MAG: TolC family protein [Phycisphaeraceae bacterium]